VKDDTVSNDDRKFKTDFLNTPDAAPMTDRPTDAASHLLGPDSKLEVKINDQKIPVNITDNMLIGRCVENEDPKGYALDLTPHGGYQSGVSRHHAAITQHDGGLYLEDLGSTNGTRINGFQLTPRRKYRLRDGDEVEFARLRTLFHFVHPKKQ
jgi:pSer/pThr/pTyr-binding forkhead associated (FHA) protein